VKKVPCGTTYHKHGTREPKTNGLFRDPIIMKYKERNEDLDWKIRAARAKKTDL